MSTNVEQVHNVQYWNALRWRMVGANGVQMPSNLRWAALDRSRVAIETQQTRDALFITSTTYIWTDANDVNRWRCCISRRQGSRLSGACYARVHPRRICTQIASNLPVLWYLECATEGLLCHLWYIFGTFILYTLQLYCFYALDVHI